MSGEYMNDIHEAINRYRNATGTEPDNRPSASGTVDDEPLSVVVQRQGMLIDMLIDQVGKLVEAGDENAGLQTVRAEQTQAAGGQIRQAHPLPTGLGDMIVTVVEGEDTFLVTWRAPNKHRQHHRFSLTEAGVSPGSVHAERAPRGAKNRMPRG